MVTDLFSQQAFWLVISCATTDMKNKLKKMVFGCVNIPYQPAADH